MMTTARTLNTHHFAIGLDAFEKQTRKRRVHRAVFAARRRP
jgi:hypothetical protein